MDAEDNGSDDFYVTGGDGSSSVGYSDSAPGAIDAEGELNLATTTLVGASALESSNYEYAATGSVLDPLLAFRGYLGNRGSK
jgi:hypothetical protein